MEETLDTARPKAKADRFNPDAFREPIEVKPARSRNSCQGPGKSGSQDSFKGTRITLRMDQVFGQSPAEVVKLFQLQGIDPSRPYRAKFTFSEVTIEQDPPTKTAC